MTRLILLPFIASILATITSAQNLIPDNLPSCAAGCTVLQQAATGCLPLGGAPQSSQGTYQSCFCQSALLTQLYQSTAVQLCSSCQSADMLIIQNWYKSDCGQGGVPLPGGNQNSATSTAAAVATSSGSKKQATSTSSANTSRPAHTEKPQGSWISTHWQWILMIILILLGMGAFAFIFVILHRRYHRKRISKWSITPGSQPNINTWTPGQSVHDLSWTARQGEKGKARETTSSVKPPAASKEKGGRLSGRFF